MKVRQISVFLENKSGRLLEACKSLAEAQVNIRALSIAETADYGVLRLIVNDPDTAMRVMVENKFTVSETEVIAVEVPDRPGGLAAVLAPLYETNVNIEYLYCFVEKSGESAMVVFRVEKLDEAIKALQAGGYNVMREEDVYII
ncbi:MAG: amino acid-binding protein [Candidatus Solincola sediminis]|uniref:Amino acid-binding protein n=1 Tax=Candidatus Solincola sediminis TaxID=1797199 RepID=A0A1F2WTC2_9ACTN|nr:MAG: amino acid-binding protein [Candidatus Solincola sediminis]OFW60867.1 MAG: amino acid-binding protein [Candidatus Solincola sediminis]